MIIIKTVNCDGVEVRYTYENIDALKKEWYKEDDMPNIPMLDDELIFAEVDGVTVNGKTCTDVMDYISAAYHWKY